MLKFLLAGLVFFAACANVPDPVFASASLVPPQVSVTSEYSASNVYMRQKELIEKMSEGYGVEVDVAWEPCGQENSFYYRATNKIVLCTEMSKYPAAALFYAAHEMGHSMTWQLTSSLSEIDADEIAALAMIDLGYSYELLGAALYHKADDTQGHIQGDSHPSNGFRAWYLACLATGADGGPPECVMLYQATKLKWETRLNDKQEE